MSSTTSWDEIKRLAADFQRVQLVESNYRLSERNCIEIINKLIELDMLNVVHSVDGKEFITEKQIEKEIYDEIYVHEGRINIVKLQTLLNIDICHIESKVAEISKQDPNLILILGQIISKDYMNKIAEEINETLQEKGSVSVSELTNLYELPADFIQQIITPRMDSLIKGTFNGKILYTQNFVNNQKALLAGAIEACIKPIRLSQVIKEYNLETAMVFDIFDELIAEKQIKGSLFGGRQEMSAVFVPEFYTKAQQQYVESFFKQNGYIEYSSLRKIGLTEPDSYVKSLFQSQSLLYLSSSCFASYFVDQITDEIEDHLNRNGFCDLSQVLPSILNEKDIAKLTVFYADKLKASSECSIMAENYLVNKSFLKSLSAKFSEKMESKASEDLKKPNNVMALRSGHAVIAGSTQVSTASAPTTKQAKSKGKKNTAANLDTPDENLIEIAFIDSASLKKDLAAMINDLNDDLTEALVEYFLKPLNHQYFDLLKQKVEQGLISSAKDAEDGESNPAAAGKKNSIKEVQERVRLSLINAKLFEKALKSFSDAKVQDTLSKHLTKTTFTEIANEMIKFLASEQLIQFNEENFSNESRAKIIQKLKEPHKQGFTEIQQALATKTSTEILETLEKVAVQSLEMSLKKADPKKEKEVVLRLRESMKETLDKEKEPAAVLHLASVLIYYHTSGFLLNAPGRCVPNILEVIRANCKEETFKKLNNFQNLIIENAKSKSDETEVENISEDLIREVKEIGINPKVHVNTKEIKN